MTNKIMLRNFNIAVVLVKMSRFGLDQALWKLL